MAQRKRDAYHFGDDPNEISDEVPPGKSVRVPVMLADGSLAGHRPGYANLTWKQIHERHAAFEARMVADAKRKPPDDDDDDDDPDEIASLEDIRAPSIKARHEYVQRLQDAWRQPLATHPATSSPERTHGLPKPIAGTSMSDAADHFRDGSPKEPQAKRDQAYEEYAASLSNAWRNPQVGRPSPGLAPQIKRQRERQTAEAK
jgi:hypothetical protein